MGAEPHGVRAAWAIWRLVGIRRGIVPEIGTAAVSLKGSRAFSTAANEEGQDHERSKKKSPGSRRRETYGFAASGFKTSCQHEHSPILTKRETVNNSTISRGVSPSALDYAKLFSHSVPIRLSVSRTLLESSNTTADYGKKGDSSR